MLTRKANAKINLFLKITGKREDGYHELDTIMQMVDFCDYIDMDLADDIEIAFSGMNVPEENTVKAAVREFFAETGIKGGIKIHVTKNIPEKAGLGGSSVDAAEVLKGMNYLYESPLTLEQLKKAAGKIGADAPFGLTGGCCRARGIGETLETVENNMNAYYLLLKPKRGISTPEAYAAYDRLPAYDEKLNIETCLKAMKEGNISDFGKYTGNSLEHAALHICPETRAILKAFENSGVSAYVLSGSGSTCVGIFEHECDAKRIQQQLLNWDLDLNRIVRAISPGGNLK